MYKYKFVYKKHSKHSNGSYYRINSVNWEVISAWYGWVQSELHFEIVLGPVFTLLSVYLHNIPEGKEDCEHFTALIISKARLSKLFRLRSVAALENLLAICIWNGCEKDENAVNLINRKIYSLEDYCNSFTFPK